MKRWGHVQILAGIAALALSCYAAPASAQQLNDRYENFGGYAGGSGVGGFANTTAGIQNLVPTTPAGLAVNPNGVGNYLVGPYFDVRPRGTDPTIFNLQIVNTNSNDSSLRPCSINPARGDYSPGDFFAGIDGEQCYNPYGGVVAKVRFRDSKRSCEVFDFTIALSCGEVWTGRVEAGPNGVPTVISGSPIVSEEVDGSSGLPPSNFGNVVTSPILDGSFEFAIPPACTDTIDESDIDHGYFEIVGLSTISCEPDRVQTDNRIEQVDVGAGKLNKSGNRWTWTQSQGPLNTNFAATHALSAVGFHVRPTSGVSFEYNATALTRYKNPAIDLAFVPNSWFLGNNPDVRQCSAYDINGTPILGAPGVAACINQANLALHKARLMGQYDQASLTAGRTNLIVTLPTKYANCQGDLPGNPRTGDIPALENPFTCGTSETISCTVYDRVENFENPEDGGGGVISPPREGGRCTLPRESTIIGIRAGSVRGEADFVLDPAGLPGCQADPTHCAGWVELELTGAQHGTVRNILFGNQGQNNLEGIFVSGYQGLPSLGLVQQEFTNGKVGGAFGAIVEATYDDPILLAPGS